MRLAVERCRRSAQPRAANVFRIRARTPHGITPLQTRSNSWRKRDAICLAVFRAASMQSFLDTALR
jgi:hypothetical protein